MRTQRRFSSRRASRALRRSLEPVRRSLERVLLACLLAAAAQLGLPASRAVDSTVLADRAESFGNLMAPLAPPPEPATPALQADNQAWTGSISQPANVRRAPSRTAEVIRELVPGTRVRVERWVSGDAIDPDNTTWAELGTGQFVYAMLLRADPPPALAERVDPPTASQWIDVDTTHQVATAYEGSRAVHTTLVSTGRPDWATPTGAWQIQRRVERETMDGATLQGQGPSGSAAAYHVDNVHWTQYFTSDGSAIHENYWRNSSTFGVPGSHGCIGMVPAEAEWFWNWAKVGTLVVVHA